MSENIFKESLTRIEAPLDKILGTDRSEQACLHKQASFAKPIYQHYPKEISEFYYDLLIKHSVVQSEPPSNLADPQDVESQQGVIKQFVEPSESISKPVKPSSPSFFATANPSCPLQPSPAWAPATMPRRHGPAWNGFGGTAAPGRGFAHIHA